MSLVDFMFNPDYRESLQITSAPTPLTDVERIQQLETIVENKDTEISRIKEKYKEIYIKTYSTHQINETVEALKQIRAHYNDEKLQELIPDLLDNLISKITKFENK